MKQARAYSEEHCSTTDLNNRADFPLQTCNIDQQLIQICFQSRHSNTRSYYTYIHFSTEEILSSCRDCPIGDRQVGVCSHRSAAKWFLAYRRHQNSDSRNQTSGSYLDLLDDSELLDDWNESSDEDDDLFSLSWIIITTRIKVLGVLHEQKKWQAKPQRHQWKKIRYGTELLGFGSTLLYY